MGRSDALVANHEHELEVVVWVALTMAHFVGSTEWLKVNKRGGFECLALVVFMLVAWPLFSVGMMIRGYADFWNKTWGKKP